MSFKLIVITPESDYPEEIKWINLLFENGLERLHIRKPYFKSIDLQNYLLQIPEKYHPRIVIHQHAVLLGEFKLGGMHLTEKSKKSVKDLGLIKKIGGTIISASFHSLADVLKSRRKYEYFFLSPVFTSISKNQYPAVFNWEDLLALVKKKKNARALGGVEKNKIQLLKQAGFSGAAVLGFIWEGTNPLQRFQELQSEIKKAIP